ncbi:acetyl-CoA carboxylase biotin carboxylase subunit family protein [Mesorhizobium sp. M0621]|uniref:ATP-grasp domain-containing protein n=1 Tax=Mesorhizobium sp. M0621 TaxID=2956974 RepID=UPI00333C5B58
MIKRALILIEGHRTSGSLYVRAAKQLGLNPITLAANPACYNYLGVEQVDAIHVNTDDLEALLRECSRLSANYDIAGITGFADFDESVLAIVADLCQWFNLPGPSPVSIRRCCDKFTQRQLLARSGIPVPAYRLAMDVTEAERSAAQIGLPVILKPAVGSGSSGVRLCRNPDEIREHMSYLLGGVHIWRSSPRILVEEFAEGPFYSVELMGDEVVGIVAVDFGSPPHFVFRGTAFPAPLGDDEYSLIADVSLSCLRALGLGWGPANIELRWTERGPVVIEVNPRLAGALEPQLVQLAYGIDLITEHVKLVIGEGWDLRKRFSQNAAARFLVPDGDGKVDWIHGEKLAAAVPGVVEVKLYVDCQSPIVKKGDYRDCIGHIMAVSPSVAQTQVILDSAAHLIRWSMTPLSSP